MTASFATRCVELTFSRRPWRDALPHDASVTVQTTLRRMLWTVIVAAFAFRAWLILASVGSEDARLWEMFAKYIDQHGLIATYRGRADFNHPPLMGLWGWLSLEVAQALDTRFSVVFKLPFLAADGLTAWLLFGVFQRRGESKATAVVAMFSLSLVSIAVAAYHGNTDSLCAALCLASACALAAKKWGWAGVLLGAAINVKLVPVMLIPVFAAFLRSRHAFVHMFAGLLACSLPFLGLALFAWHELLENVLGYGSSPYQWGVSYFIQESQRGLPRLSFWLNEHYVPAGRYILLGSMMALGLVQRWLRTLNVFEAGALALALFMVLIPGFGIQYLVWPVPLLFAARPTWAIQYATLSGVFASLVYFLFWTGTTPWFSHFAMSFPPPTPLLGLLAWGMLLGYTATGVRQMFTRARRRL